MGLEQQTGHGIQQSHFRDVCSWGLVLTGSGFMACEENPSHGGLSKIEVSFLMDNVMPESRQLEANVMASQAPDPTPSISLF